MPYPVWTELELTLAWIKTDTRMWGIVFQPLLEIFMSKYLQTQLISLRTWLVTNVKHLPFALQSGLQISDLILCLRISWDSIFPKTNLAVGVKEKGGHQWVRVLKLSLDHPAPESCIECLKPFCDTPKQIPPPRPCLLQHLKFFRSF